MIYSCGISLAMGTGCFSKGVPSGKAPILCSGHVVTCLSFPMPVPPQTLVVRAYCLNARILPCLVGAKHDILLQYFFGHIWPMTLTIFD